MQHPAATGASLLDWLAWQESLNPAEIDLGLDRVRQVWERLHIQPPEGRVLTVAGTNGKGSTVAAVSAVLAANELRTGVYTSPHLVRYNERIAIAGRPASDAAIVSAFERIEAVRGDIPLTYFEFGTLAAFCCFSEAHCDAWVLEVGLGGRLDAVNIVDADVALITTVDLDHQAWLGDDIETIAREKAGILRRGKPAFYGDTDVPESVQAHAADLDAQLRVLSVDYSLTRADYSWSWQGHDERIEGLAIPPGGAAQLRNQALALAAVEACDPALLDVLRAEPDLLAAVLPPGRMQRHDDAHCWLLDVAHNPQAGAELADALREHPPETVVLGMLKDKKAADFVAALGVTPQRWLLCPTDGPRGASAAELAELLELHPAPRRFPGVAAALEAARDGTPAGGNILVCGSFSVVGPALDWLGLYSADTG
ncbi:MAG: bifunctional tetrahydrofolate synthase/dihydrofolate synthase [Gammaproteobacteria bacterium]|nr:bifunctional tetrahydrofolate synthase/dihydrofolate synthase [Gammaproteobacteria bacterium]NND53629.1 bifunctional tetrahydrofolate synthase/dihydrofolate synthase [Gammaproteobacteria bacterium]